LVQEPPRPSSIEPSIPLALELVVQHAMAKKPSERFQSIAELDEALAPFDPSGGTLMLQAPDSAPVDTKGRTMLSQPGISSQTQGGDLTPSETVLIPLGTALAFATPLVLFLRHVGRHWQSTPRAMELGARVRLTVLSSASAYGLAALFVQLFESVLRRTASELSLPGWPLLCGSLALAVGAATWALTQKTR
jgi:serine/threonine-protein kinase